MDICELQAEVGRGSLPATTFLHPTQIKMLRVGELNYTTNSMDFTRIKPGGKQIEGTEEGERRR